MITRRHLLAASGVGVALAGSTVAFPELLQADAAIADLPAPLSQGTRDEAVLEALPGKKPLIKLSYRPPNYETPLEGLVPLYTPNDLFFVRYHLAVIPEIDVDT